MGWGGGGWQGSFMTRQWLIEIMPKPSMELMHSYEKTREEAFLDFSLIIAHFYKRNEPNQMKLSPNKCSSKIIEFFLTNDKILIPIV